MSKSSPMVFKQKGSFQNTEKLFREDRRKKLLKVMSKYGEMGVKALSSATPVQTGKTAASWTYEINVSDAGVSIQWKNTNKTDDGKEIVVLLVRGHGTRDGHYIRGNDFVTPAIKPIFDKLADEAWAEVTGRNAKR